MLADRNYMRGGSPDPYRSATVILLLVNAALFVIQSVLDFYFRGSSAYYAVREYLYLSPAGMKSGFVWQLFTFQFLHGSLLHLLGNSVGLFFFGRALEEELGRQKFLQLYLGSGVVGGIVQMTLAFAVPAHFGGAVVGASAGVCGLIAAFARLYPERQLTMLLFFIIPFSILAKWLLVIEACITLFGLLIPTSNIAHGAHAGGMIAGIAFVAWFVHGSGMNFPWTQLKRPAARPRVLIKTVSPREALWNRGQSASDDELPPAEFISKEVDPILDKISAHGIQSLTARERKILEAARERMSKR